MTPTQLLDALRPTLSHEHFATRSLGILLMLTIAREQVDLAEVATQLNLRRPSITRLMDGLSIKGFAVRIRNEDDRRRVFIRATPKGAAFIAKLCEAT